MSEFREIQKVIEPQTVMEGAGVRLRRSFAPSVENEMDPFLLFDHFAFNDPIEGPIAGFPKHPHRGIETVTYMLAGSTRHRDSLGNLGVIGPGDVQWMTSGSGILHEEMPKRGPDGRVRGFQLWVNLPSDQKMSRPRYQGINEGEIPLLRGEGSSVRLIAGAYGGEVGPVSQVAAKPVYMDVSLESGAEFKLRLPPKHTSLAYVFEGAVSFGVGPKSEPVQAVRMVRFDDGSELKATAAAGQSARFLFFAGAPFAEPIFPYGPFVMNSKEEIELAIHELRRGTFVKEGAGWKSGSQAV